MQTRDAEGARFPMSQGLDRCLAGLSLAVFLMAVAGRADWSQTAGGTYDYLATGNWSDGTVNDVFPSSLTLLGAQTLTFGADRTTPAGLDFSYGGNVALTLRGNGGNRTLTLGGNVNLDTSGGTTANVTLGTTTANQFLNVDLGGVAREFAVASGRTLSLLNNVSNGSLSKAGGGTLSLQSTGNSFLGDIAVSGGILEARGGDGALGDPANSVSLTNGSQLQFGASFILDPRRTLSVSGGAKIYRYSAGAVNVLIPGDITGSGGLTFANGSPGFLLAGENDYTGTTTINSWLRISSLANIGGPSMAFTLQAFSNVNGFSIMGTELTDMTGCSFSNLNGDSVSLNFDLQDPGLVFTWDKNMNALANSAGNVHIKRYGAGTFRIIVPQDYYMVQANAMATGLNGGWQLVDAAAGGRLAIRPVNDNNRVDFAGGSLKILGGSGDFSQNLGNLRVNVGGGDLVVDNADGSGSTVVNLGMFFTPWGVLNGGNMNIVAQNPGSGSAVVNSASLNDADGTVGSGRIVFGGSDWVTSATTTEDGVAYDAATDLVTGTQPNGAIVMFTTSAPGGMAANTGYHVVQSTGSAFKLSTTPGGTAINLTTTGTGTLRTLGPLSAYAGYTVGLPTSGSSAGVNFSHTGNGSVTASESANTLKILTTAAGQSLAITAGETLTLATGGLLFTGAHDYAVTGGALASGMAGTSDLVLQPYGAGKLTIGSAIADGNGLSTLTVGGTGTVVLSGENTYSGVTYINRATVSIASDTHLGGANGTISPVTSTTSSPTVTCTAASLPAGFRVGVSLLGKTVTAISGSSGSFTITLNGNANANQTNGTRSWAIAANLYLYGGTLRVTDDVTLQETNAGGGTTTATRNVFLNGGIGTFDIADGKTLTVPGTVSGYRLALANSDGGAGTLLLNAANTFASGVHIQAGVLKLGHNSAVHVQGFNTLSFGSGPTATLQVNGARSIAFAGLNSDSTSAVVENGSAGDATVSVYNGWDNTYAGVLRDGAAGTLAFAKAGRGKLTLTGASTHTGPTMVQGGTLQVDGSLAAASAVTVQKGTLGGTGTVAGPVTVQAGGSLAPGGSVGTLITGALTLQPGAVLEFELDTPAASDLVAVVGDLTLDGVLDITALEGFGAGQYTLLTYTGTLTDQGLELAGTPDASLAYAVKTTSNSVVLSAAAPGTVLLLR